MLVISGPTHRLSAISKVISDWHYKLTTIANQPGFSRVGGCSIFFLMLARRIFPLQLLASIFILAVICTSAIAQASKKEPAPRFTAKTLTGEKFTNESVKGKVVLLQFWTTWCQYCRHEQLLVDQMDHEFAGKGLVVLAVDVGESKKKVKKYLDDNPRTCRIVLTEDTNLAAMYAATSYPVYVAIDRNGNIAGIQRGAGGEDALRSLLNKAGLETDDTAPQ
jgi:thiol-disulfide isomerase/thioredoxin